ncbi:MAG: TIGR01212 family radical SAM protein [Rikenellaceae bacterium]
MEDKRYSQLINSETLPEAFGGRRFNSYSNYFKRVMGERVQKVAINGGFTCPNRDGKVGWNGCSFCINEAFTPSYCVATKSITQQINEGIEFHLRRYRDASKYLAYFQSFSNTYASIEVLRKRYSEALDNPLVVGLIIGTRPDCVDTEKLDYLAELSKDYYIAIEYGVESTFDTSLERINRGHNFEVARWAIEQSAQRGIHTGAHFIIGLPGESVEMLHSQIETINTLPLSTIKFHQLQVFKGTTMQSEYDLNPDSFPFWEVDEYIELFVDLLEKLRPDIVVERFASEAPPRYHHGRNWDFTRNETLLQKLDKRLTERGTYQGCLYTNKTLSNV